MSKTDKFTTLIFLIVMVFATPLCALLSAAIYAEIWDLLIAQQYGAGPSYRAWYGISVLVGLVTSSAVVFYTGHYNAKHTHLPRDQGIQRSLDAMTAILALAQGDTPENIAACVKICVRRCQELEQKLIDFQDSHTVPQQIPVVQNDDMMAWMRNRIDELEADLKRRGMP
jgi:hypothetical protein